MISYKDVLALSLQGLNISQIKEKLGYDQNTIRSVIEKATMKGLYPKGWEGLSEEQLKKQLKKRTKQKRHISNLTMNGYTRNSVTLLSR